MNRKKKKRTVFNPNNMEWIFVGITSVGLISFTIALFYAPSYEFAILLFVVLLSFLHSLYRVFSYRIVIGSDSIVILKLFERSYAFSYLYHKFVFGGSLVRRNKPNKIWTTRGSGAPKRLMWIYQLDEYEQPIKMMSLYFEWDMFNKSYMRLQDEIEVHCKRIGYESHIQKSDKDKLIIQEV